VDYRKRNDGEKNISAAIFNHLSSLFKTKERLTRWFEIP
jgi:hypothetical protein